MGKNRKPIMTYEKDFQYISKIVFSCQTYEQMLTTKKLFENFKQKWIKQIPKMEFINYMYRFQSTYDMKRTKLCLKD
jgi:hypothetical protein